ncbi:sensor histidine kinase [Dyadobacter jiangsuensis]|uniref:Histidine kinase n=1 Tax=Dyadobacter jiangsuensis TaxID=1591085 RepID=A0A2P8FNF3_9BACT|nr:histidine kinase [Dyadobacter jiangsuensis]PSL23257.1 histidine kinase [Dyadobacter jiangsuensis]
MVVIEKVTGALSRRKDSLLYLGLFCWISIGFTIGRDDYWETYAQSLLASLVLWSPVLAVTWVREGSGEGRFAGRNRRIWLGCFFGYLPILLVVSGAQLSPGQLIWPVVFTGGLCIAGLECVLVVESQYVGRLREVKWVRKLSLEKAVLMSITGLALLLGAMAVSSLDNPLYHSGKQLLVGFEIHFLKIAARFPTFLSYSLQLLVMYLAGYFFFYLNSRWLVPVVLKEQGILHYVLCSAALVGVFYPLWGQLLASLPFSKVLGGVFSANPFVAENAFGAMLILLISLPVLLAIQWARQNSLITALQHEKSVAELDLLKQQLNPHFFFNTLNNLYALSLQRSEQTPESILQLSELMRYVIYKAKEPFVRMEDEVKYLKDYIQLQKIRLKRSLDLQFEEEIEDGTIRIAPLLLIVFVENAFKHGVENAENDAFLRISLKADQRFVRFVCENSYEPATDAQTGIGLTNLRKRLALLYPGKHRLTTSAENGVFTASLEIDLL